ncbi:MAG: type IX secretion system sortase PorU [Chitinophagales bacterium]|nr:type IX secretion system sortase PorU [Chitinophagales bacterium]
MRFLLLSFSLFTLVSAQAGNIQISDEINWGKDIAKVQTSASSWVQVLNCTGCDNDEQNNYLPTYTKVIAVPTEGDMVFSFTETKFEHLNTLPSGIDSSTLPTEIEVKYHIAYQRKQPKASLFFVPLRKNAITGAVEKLVSYKIEISILPNAKKQAAATPSYAANSVLSTGSWYKVSVDKDGLYKIDYQFLKDIGINPDGIDPRNIHIYGNGGGMLPEANSEFRHDDLTENAIIVSGENDGVFNQGDYILFYGQAPDRWVYDGSQKVYHHQLNLYSKVTAYFITVNSTAGKRINTAPVVANPTETVTSFDDHQFHNLEDVNFMESGRVWYGEYFSFSTPSQSFTFDFPNLVTTEPVYFKTSLAARSLSGSTNFGVNVNSQNVANISLSTVSGSYDDAFAQIKTFSDSIYATSSALNVNYTFSNANSSAEGWLDYIELNARRNLSYTGGLLSFRDKNSFGPGKRAQFVISNANSNIRVLDVTDPTNAAFTNTSLNGSQLSFTANTDILREFVAYDANGSFFTPGKIGNVANQNLHAVDQPEMVIVTSAELMAAANRLADHRRTNTGLSVAVIDIQQVYNEFSSGVQDLGAIRDFMRMLYVRAGNDEDALPRFLLLFGDGSYDYKDLEPNNSNIIPVFESWNSTNPISSFCTDDFYGFLDENEGMDAGSSDLLDIGIGRIPVSTLEKANEMVDKIIHYESSATLGSWRNNLTFIGDDEDGDTHLQQSLAHCVYMETNFPEYNVDKIMLDAYKQESTPAGSRYPDVKDAINKKMFSGCLILNYSGHGGVNGMAHERIMDINDIRSWENYDKMPLFMTATCEFSRFDAPSKLAAGEEVLLNPKGGAIALVTTMRLVFASSNKEINDKFLQSAFNPYEGTRMPTLGEATMLSKNITSNSQNKRKFVLLGDPALTLAYPEYEVVTTHIDDHPIAVTNDTLKALKQITIKGEVHDHNGVKMETFNGVVYPTIYDKPIDVTTLANDPSSRKTSFQLLKNIVFKGKASVTNGEFSFTFIVPKDISYNFGQGKISYYADNGDIDANGYSFDIVVGGTADSFATDNAGPVVDVYMNDEQFVFGGITDANPILLVKLNDFSGINTVGNGIGHDITAVLDDDSRNTMVLNDYYESDQDNYKTGSLYYPLANIAEGRHRINVKAWDVYNNSAEGYTEFVVASTASLALEHVMNYPNPFMTSTNFSFEHNKPGQPMFVKVQIYGISGQLVKTIQESLEPEGYRVSNIQWDGLDDNGQNIGKGVYVYKITVLTADGESAQGFEKLVLLK